MCKSSRGFKSNVRNKAAHEGCITEGYIVTEFVTFCSMYLNNAVTFHNMSQRNQDGFKGAGTRFNIDQNTMKQFHCYIMFNSDDFLQLRM
jgi:hypothetical protein